MSKYGPPGLLFGVLFLRICFHPIWLSVRYFRKTHCFSLFLVQLKEPHVQSLLVCNSSTIGSFHLLRFVHHFTFRLWANVECLERPSGHNQRDTYFQRLNCWAVLVVQTSTHLWAAKKSRKVFNSNSRCSMPHCGGSETSSGSSPTGTATSTVSHHFGCAAAHCHLRFQLALHDSVSLCRSRSLHLLASLASLWAGQQNNTLLSLVWVSVTIRHHYMIILCHSHMLGQTSPSIYILLNSRNSCWRFCYGSNMLLLRRTTLVDLQTSVFFCNP